jgi:hypothetical protein
VPTAAVRAALAYLGLIFLGGALAMLVLPSMRRTPWVPATIRWVADQWWVSLVVLSLGVAIPILLRVGRWVIEHLGPAASQRPREGARPRSGVSPPSSSRLNRWPWLFGAAPPSRCPPSGDIEAPAGAPRADFRCPWPSRRR